MKAMSACGITYVATRSDLYVEEAFLAAFSAKRYVPNLPVTLFTDRPNHSLCERDVFDDVVPITREAMDVPEWSAGQLDRLACLQRSPYRRTLHLDTDTRVFSGEVRDLFAVLDRADIAMVEAAPDESFSRLHFGKRILNAGLILYESSEPAFRCFTEWAAITARNFCAASTVPVTDVLGLGPQRSEAVIRELLLIDQIALAEILTPEVNRFGLRLEVLDYSWNHRGSRLPANNRKPLRILHRPRHKLKTHTLELEEALRVTKATQRFRR